MTTINGNAPQTRTPNTTPQNDTPAPAQPEAEVVARPQEEDKVEEKKPNLFGGFSFGDIGKKLKETVEDAKDSFKPKLSEEERAALEKVHTMLGPDKLGGADGKFNFGDRAAITAALMRDTEGMRSKAIPGIEQDFARKRAQHRCRRGIGGRMRRRLLPKPGTGPIAEGIAKFAANRAFDGAQGPLARAARKQINSTAPAMMNQQLNAALDKMKVDPNTANQPDNSYRSLTIGELEAFEGDAQVLEQMRERMVKQYGFEVVFPEGVTQEAIRHVLDGKFGLPPGGKIVKP